MKQIKINQYKNRYATKSFQSVTLESIIANIKTNNIDTPKPERIANIFSSYSTKGRRHEHIETFTGLMFIDLDNCTDASEVKKILSKGKSTVAVWYSSSGNIHALIRIPICKSTKEFKRRFNAFINIAKSYIKDYVTIDITASNPTQLAFESHDKNIYFNPDAKVFKGIEKEEVSKLVTPIKQIFISSKKERWCIDYINKKIGNITSNGHPQVRKTGSLIGGWVASGKVSSETALNTLKQAVRNNEYLNSKRSSDTIYKYLKTVEDGFNFGLKIPLPWTDYSKKAPLQNNQPKNIKVSVQKDYDISELLAGQHL